MIFEFSELLHLHIGLTPMAHEAPVVVLPSLLSEIPEHRFLMTVGVRGLTAMEERARVEAVTEWTLSVSDIWHGGRTSMWTSLAPLAVAGC